MTSSNQDTKLRVHPVADLFPLLAGDELAELVEDIKERGLLQPIVLDSEGRILDGRNRYAACQLAGVEPQFTTYDGPDPDGYALSVNVARRHLGTGPRAMITAVGLERQGKRHNGRWARGSVPADPTADPAITKSGNSAWINRVAEAGLILDWCDAVTVNQVIAGGKPFSEAVGEAHENRRRDAEIAAKRDRLGRKAPELLTAVDDQTITLDDAVAALDAREEKARQDAAERAAEREERAALALSGRWAA